MVVTNTDEAQAVVLEDTPAGKQTVRVEIQRQAAAGNTWDYTKAGEIYDMPLSELNVLRDEDA
jgi:hypothetical protein